MAMLVACRDCATIQRMPPPPGRGRLECWRCGNVLENTTGRSLDAALACALATLLLLIPGNLLPLLTVHTHGLTSTTYLASGLVTSWRQGWPLVTLILGMQGVVLPFVRFGLICVTLTAIRFGVRSAWVGPAFRWSEKLDLWAMADVLFIGFGVGYGRVVSQVPVRIDVGGWCFVVAALLTLVTRASLERRAVWRRLGAEPEEAPPDAIACTSCDLLLPGEAEGEKCPRCGARVYSRRPSSLQQCTALVIATWALMPLAYGVPMSALWVAGEPHPHTIIDGIQLLIQHGFYEFAVLITLVSVGVPFTKAIGLSWFLISIRRHSSWELRRKTKLYRFIDESGRWSNLDPFTVMIFAPMVQFNQLAHINVMGGSAAFLAMVVLSMLAARVFDPRLLWDAAEEGAGEAQTGMTEAERVSGRGAELPAS